MFLGVNPNNDPFITLRQKTENCETQCKINQFTFLSLTANEVYSKLMNTTIL